MQKSSKNRIKPSVSEEKITITFAQDAKRQLEELKTYFEKSSVSDIVVLGISFLEMLKEKELQRGRKYLS